MSDSTELPRRTGEAIAPDRWLVRLERAVAAVKAGGDAEDVHRLRIAAARLDVWLRLGGWHVLRDDLRWLRRRAAAVRDIDVALASDVDDPTRESLARQRESARRLLARQLAHPRASATSTALRELPPTPSARARKALRRWSLALLTEGDRTDFQRDSAARLHRFRRRCRRLRFASEWLENETRELTSLQDRLGAVHDLFELQRRLAANDSARSRLDAEIAGAREKARPAWEAARDEVAEWT